MIRIDKVRVNYGKKIALQVDEINFGTGKVHGIIGLNGAGKTTFFNALAAFLKTDSGRILLNEKPIHRSDIGYLETSNFFYSHLTGQEYLDIFPKTKQQIDLEKLNQLLQVPLNQLIENYSTGMKKKLALLAVLKQEKPVYIFDEPFNGLDLESNKVLELILQNLKAKGKTIFISSHVLSPLFTVCDELHLLQQGQFVKHYLPAQFHETDHDLYAAFNQQAAALLSGSL